MTQPFTQAARAQTMLRDINELRQSIREQGDERIQSALDRCERWFDQLEVKSGNEMFDTFGENR